MPIFDDFITNCAKDNFKKIISFFEYGVVIAIFFLFLFIFLILNLKIEITVPIERIYVNNMYLLATNIKKQYWVGEDIVIKAMGKDYKAKIDNINFFNNNYIFTVNFPMNLLAKKNPRLVIAEIKILKLLF